MAKLDGRYRKWLISTDLDQPAAIVVNPSLGYKAYILKKMFILLVNKEPLSAAGICSVQDDVLDRLGKQTQNRVSVDGRSAQRGAGEGGGPGLAYWAGSGLPEWKQNLLV